MAALVVPRPALAAGVGACPEAGIPFETVEAVSARDGTTLRLKDGREVRLSGIVAPGLLDGEDAAANATARLDALVSGKTLALHGREDARDRYGRLLAQVAFKDGNWIQAELVSAGAARVAPEESEARCAASLLELERAARADRKGLWQEAGFAVESVVHVEALTAAAGRFAVVEGVVRRVGETASRTYLDFGRRYNEDFTIVIPRSARAAFAAAGLDLKNLRGKRVRVRGVVFLSGGPAIEIRKPASLELLAGGGA